MKFVVEKAKRSKIYTKIALMGSSGSGKTYSGLLLASGMRDKIAELGKKNPKILLANTEGSRGKYYANEFDYDIVDLDPPYKPELYIELIDYAVDSGYDILVIDSTSPEWEGAGGCLELHAMAGGRYQDWASVTPRHQKFIDAIANSPIHIIATMRGKDQYETEKDDNGKLVIRKLGLGAKQREGYEYEFTCTLLLDQKTHIAIAQKDNTHLFEGDYTHILDSKDGEKIIEWANSDVSDEEKKPISEKTKSAKKKTVDEDEYNSLVNAIKEKALALNEAGNAEIYQKAVMLRLGEGQKVSTLEHTVENYETLVKLAEDLSEY